MKDVEDVNLTPPSVDGGETEAFPPNVSIEKSLSPAPGAEAKAFTPTVSIEKELPYLEIIIGIVLIIIIVIAFAAVLGFTFGGEVVSWFLGIVVVIASLSIAVAPLRFLIIRSIRRLLPQDPDQQRQQRNHRRARQLRHEQRQQRRQSRRRQ